MAAVPLTAVLVNGDVVFGYFALHNTEQLYSTEFVARVRLYRHHSIGGS